MSHKKNGGDFFSELAKANKNLLQRPLVRLMNYKEIKELSSSSKDNEVIEFLRTKLEANLEGTASFLTVRIKNVFKKLVEVKFDSKELTLIAELVARDRQIKPKQLEVPEIKVGFYEVMTEDNVGRLIAMCVNDIVLSTPHVISPITDGNTQI